LERSLGNLAAKEHPCHFKNIQRRHFNHMVTRCFNRRDSEAIWAPVLEQVPNVIYAVGHYFLVGFPQWLAKPFSPD
jgi:hypothetical protein